jgi:hypothetical protein
VNAPVTDAQAAHRAYLAELARVDMRVADWDYTGLLFENMALRDVRVYLDATGGTTYHYLDSNGLEVDMIAELLRLHRRKSSV